MKYKYYYQIDFIDAEGYANYIDTHYSRAVAIRAVDLLNRANQCLNSNTKFVADKYRYIDGLDESDELIEENITNVLTIQERLGGNYGMHNSSEQ